MKKHVALEKGLAAIAAAAILWTMSAACLANGAAGSAKRLSFTAGMLLREFEADFRAPIHRVEGEGATGRTTLYQGENEPFLYEDGSIIYDPMWSHPFPYGDGTAFYSIEDASQIGQRFPMSGPILVPPSGDGPPDLIFVPKQPMFPLDTFTFHSREHLHEGPSTLSDTDEELVPAPYVAAHWDLVDRADGLRVSAFGRYALAHAELGASQRFREVDRTHTFTYDEYPSPLPLPAPPYTTGPPFLPLWLIYSNEDTLMAWGPDPLFPPTMDPRHNVSDRGIVGLARADLDVFLHEFALGVECSYEVMDRVRIGALAGPVLGIADWDYDYTTRWSDEATGAPLGSLGYSTSDEDVLFGATIEGTVSVDLDSEGRLFVEAGAGYVWYEELDVALGQAETELDLSSFVASLGVGVRL